MKTYIAMTMALLLLSCADKNAKTPQNGPDADAVTGPLRDIAQATRCNTEDASQIKEDLNNDGTVDVRKIYSQVGELQVLTCKESDINFDGKLDLYQFFDNNGKLKRDEADLDFDGNLDIISYWSNKYVFRQELDQNSDGIVDTIRYLKDGKIFKSEGDMDQNGVIDYWEYYTDGQLVRIGIDHDGDGKADQWNRDKIAQSKQAAQEAQLNDDTEPPESDTAQQSDTENN